MFLYIFILAKVIWVFYRHGREANRYLRSNDSIPRSRYLRFLALGSLDVVITLPFATSVLVDGLKSYETTFGTKMPFYNGWMIIHSDWAPATATYATLVQSGAWALCEWYYSVWSSVTLALAVFAFFGLTSDALRTYMRIVCHLGNHFGWRPAESSRLELGEIAFGVCEQVTIDTQQHEGSLLANISVTSIPESNNSKQHEIHNLNVIGFPDPSNPQLDSDASND